MLNLTEIVRLIKENQSQVEKWQEYIQRIPMLQAAIEILKILSKYGRAYIVGGAVRDIIMGKDPKDIDIATEVPIEKIDRLFSSHDIGKNREFGIIVVQHNGHSFEIANFREDGKYKDGRRPEKVTVGVSFETDAGRRDFTINAMGIDADGNIIDFFDGQRDIKNKIIKTVGDPEQRFNEDYLRMLRAARFASKMGFKIDDPTFKAIQTHAGKIQKIAPERVQQELIKMASQSGEKFAIALQILKDSGLLKHILPELEETDAYEHSVETHPEGRTVWEHILAAIRINQLENPIINLAIALHDIGKIRTRSYEGNKVKYLDHAKASVDIIEDIAKRLKMDNETKEALMFAAENHMKAHDLFKMRESYVVNLIMNKNWDVLYNVAYADVAARGHLFDEKRWRETLERIARLTEKYKNRNEMNKIKKVVGGELIMRLKGIPEGPLVGKYIKATVEWILDNNIDINDQEAIINYINSLSF